MIKARVKVIHWAQQSIPRSHPWCLSQYIVAFIMIKHKRILLKHLCVISAKTHVRTRLSMYFNPVSFLKQNCLYIPISVEYKHCSVFQNNTSCSSAFFRKFFLHFCPLILFYLKLLNCFSPSSPEDKCFPFDSTRSIACGSFTDRLYLFGSHRL